jgi:retron-type reverse transcriptase
MLIFEKLCEVLKISHQTMDSLCDNAPKKYKVYTIPKRTAGHRIIAQPTPELKKLQRTLISLLEPKLPIHSAAFAYRKGLGILHNAEKHKNSRYLLKMDFQNFFNKIKPITFFNALQRHGFTLSSKDRYLLGMLLFWKPGLKRSKTLMLSVGAPSSPLITNFVMYAFDKYMHDWCIEHKITYSRYADDITFSTNKENILFGVPNVVNRALRATTPGMVVNDSKTIFTSKAHNRHITGVTLTCDGKISLGRSKKRMISSMIHKSITNDLSSSDMSYLHGLLSHAEYIEPTFLKSVTEKYGETAINRIKGNFNND